MKTIGFANKYYTLWIVGEPYREYTSEYSFYEKQDLTYVKNLSMDLEKAKEKLKGEEYDVDLNLRGSSSFTRTCGELVDETPENIFKFGRYSGKDVTEATDIEYVKWYYEETKNKFAEELLIKNGYRAIESIWVDGGSEKTYFSPEEYDERKEAIERQNYINSLKDGFHFTDKEKVELEVKQVGFFGFDSTYGRCYVATFGTIDGLQVKYVGGSPPEMPEEEFVKIKCTIKHDTSRGHPETKIQRIKLIKT